MTQLGDALARVHKSAHDQVVRSEDMSRADRELLLRHEWLQPILRGWYLMVRPDTRQGDSSPWYANFWNFIRLYFLSSYGNKYCLSAESSLDLHLKTSAIPLQVIAIAEKGNRIPLKLPFKTSLLVYSDPENIPEERIEIQGIQVMSLPLSLCKVAPSFFQKKPKEAEIALRLIRDPVDLIQTLIQYDFKRAANRIVGAYQFLGEKDFARQIQTALSLVGFHITAENPFKEEFPFLSERVTSPYAARIETLWKSYRETVMEIFAKQPKAINKIEYFHQLKEIYTMDAYNSLSIEGYQVNAELVERVQNPHWNPDIHPEDRTERNALAARGYYEAFQEVKKSIERLFEGTAPAEVVRQDLPLWFRCLFAPQVRANIIRESDLYGYRKGQVFIRNSRHIPLPRESLLDAMEAFYRCLKEEQNPAVRAVLGHFIFVYIHPFMDGNGRIGRFLMNAMFASGGLPWIVLAVKNRDFYFSSLEMASTGGTIRPLAEFILASMKENTIH